jgi:hypothetical protein
MVFTNRHNKSRHVKICGQRTDVVVATENTQEIQPIPHQVINNSMNNCSINNNSLNVHVEDKSVKISINCFGKENMQHITNEFKDARLTELNGRGLLNFIREVHFNPQHPENHNIRRHDSKFCKIYEDGEWTLHSVKIALTDLINNYKYQLCERLYAPEYKEAQTCEVTWNLIFENLMKFDKNRNPVDFYSVVQGIVALINNLEAMYKDDRFKHAISTDFS